MADMIPETPNPISVEPGPDANIRRFLHDRFEFHRSLGSFFDVNDWSKWTETEIADAVKVLSLDYLEGPGQGFDWVSAGYQAEFIMAVTFHQVACRANLFPAPRFYLNFFDPFMNEGLEVEMVNPTDTAMDPLPGMPQTLPPTESRRARAPLMVPPPKDAGLAADGALVEGVKQLSKFFVTTSNLPLLMMGAALTLWRSLQVSHQIRGGAVFRGIQDSAAPEIPVGAMRITYARTGAHVDAAVLGYPTESTLFLE